MSLYVLFKITQYIANFRFQLNWNFKQNVHGYIHLHVYNLTSLFKAHLAMIRVLIATIWMIAHKTAT